MRITGEQASGQAMDQPVSINPYLSESGKISLSGIIASILVLCGIVLTFIAGLQKNTAGVTGGLGLVTAGGTLLFKKAVKDQAIVTSQITAYTQTKTVVANKAAPAKTEVTE